MIRPTEHMTARQLVTLTAKALKEDTDDRLRRVMWLYEKYQGEPMNPDEPPERNAVGSNQFGRRAG